MKNNIHVIVSYHKYYYDVNDDEFYYQLNSLTVLHNDNKIDLPITDKKYNNFKEIQKTVLRILSNNNIKLNYYIECNAKWYNIYYVSLDLPFKLTKYSSDL